jgi:hypothetical protein
VIIKKMLRREERPVAKDTNLKRDTLRRTPIFVASAPTFTSLWPLTKRHLYATFNNFSILKLHSLLDDC